ncbi:MAG: class I SAM-dependent methyltransferase [Gaiellaceae bacterium]
MDPDPNAGIGERTIRDFGEQWSHYPDNVGYHASLALLQDILGPLLSVRELAGKRVAEIGSGTGRVVGMLLQGGAEHVFAVEPSVGVHRLRANVAAEPGRVEVIHGPGEALPQDGSRDFVFVIGVLPFIPHPIPVLQTALHALRPGGRLVVWVYSHEGNAAYVPLCRVLPLPMREYVTTTFARFSRSKRREVIYDQLNPTYVRWFRRNELEQLVTDAGFVSPRLYHRHGYSWTLVAERPDRARGA